MKNKISFITFGDCLFEDEFIKSNQINRFINKYNKCDFITFNLETVVSDLPGSRKEKSFNFKTKLHNMEEFYNQVKVPIVCNIANNHVFDYGKECFLDTINNLENLNVHYTGISKNLNLEQGITFINIKNYNIAFIGAFNGNNVEKNKIGLTPINNILFDKVEYAKKKASFVIVHLHWGHELALSPSPKQVEIAHKLVESGADIILGHHPHVMQGIEKYNKSLIIYSLGNFQIQCAKDQCNEEYSNILEIEICDNSEISYKKTPIFIDGRIPNIINKGDIKLEKYNSICKINEFYLEKNNWKYFYCDVCNEYIRDSFNSWKIRKNNNERLIFFKFIRWIMNKLTITMFVMYLFNKIFKIREKIYEKFQQ